MRPRAPDQRRLSLALAATSHRVGVMAVSDFNVKASLHMFLWTAVDQQALRKGKLAAKKLVRDGGGRNIDLSGLSFEPDGIVFPFRKALPFRNAYASIYRQFKPLLDEAGVTKDQWGFKVVGEPVDPMAAEPTSAATSVATSPVEMVSTKKEVTDPDIWPPSVPLKLARGIRCDKGCGMRVRGTGP